MKITNPPSLLGHIRALLKRATETIVVYANLPTFGKYCGENLVQDVFEMLTQSDSGDKTLIFPTYFLAEGSVDRFKTSSGVLSQFVIDYQNGARSGSVLHSHLAIGDKAEAVISPSVGSFNQDSDFHQMLEMDATILMLGCNFDRGGTLLHQVEADLEVPYRAWEDLQKTVRHKDGREEQVMVPYFSRSRPDLKENFQRAQSDFMATHEIIQAPLGYGYSLVLNASALYEFAVARVKKDPIYLVRDAT